MGWLNNFYDFRFKWTATSEIGIHPTKVWLSELVNFKNAIWTLEQRYAIKICFKLGKNAMRWKLGLLLWPRDQETEVPGKHAGSPRQKKARQSKSTHKLLMISFFDRACMIYMHLVPTGQSVNKKYFVKVLSEFRKRVGQKRPALFKPNELHYLQDNAPFRNSNFVTDDLTKMGMKTAHHRPYNPILAPWDFWLFPKPRDCRYETIEEMK